MNCEQAGVLLIELVYDDPGAVRDSEFREHFASCRRCSGEYLELLATRQLLGEWPDEEPASSLVFLPAARKQNRLRGWFGGLAAMRPSAALAGSFALLLLFLALGNVRLSWGSGRFHFQSGLGGAATAPLSAETPEGEELLRMVDRIVTESEQRQNRQTLALLQRLADNVEYKRQMDLLQVRDDLGQLHHNFFQVLEKNSVLLEKASRALQGNRY